MFQLLSQVLYQLHTPAINTENTHDPTCDVNTRSLTPCVHSFSLWLVWRSWLSLSVIFRRDSISSFSRSVTSSISSCSFLFSCKDTNKRFVILEILHTGFKKWKKFTKASQKFHFNIKKILCSLSVWNVYGKESESDLHTSSSLSMLALRQGTHDLNSLFSSSNWWSLNTQEHETKMQNDIFF